MTALNRPTRWRPQSSSTRKRSYPDTQIANSSRKRTSSSTSVPRIPRSRHSLSCLPLRKASSTEAPHELDFKPSWLKSNSSTPRRHNSLLQDEIEDAREANASIAIGFQRSTPIHRYRTEISESPLSHLPPSLVSPFESERKSSGKLGALRLKLSKVNRLTDAEEARMMNLQEFQAGDLNDPRSKASRIMDVRVVHNGVREDTPFITISCEVVSDVNVNSSVGGFVGLSAGRKLFALFKPSLLQASLHRLAEGALIRLFNPVIISNGSSELSVLCTQVSEVIHIAS